MKRFFLITAICCFCGYAVMAHASGSSTPSLGEHSDVMEWVAKGLMIFLLAEIWRNQRTLFKRQEDLAEALKELQGFCKGKNSGGKSC